MKMTLPQVLALLYLMLWPPLLAWPQERAAAVGKNLLNKKLSPEEMKADVEALVAVLQEAHPFLYEYTLETAWQQQIESIKQAIGDSLTQFAFYRLITPLLVSIHEEHTFLAPSPALEQAHQTQKRILPFRVLLLENRAFVDSTYAKEVRLPRGTELLSINGRSLETILSMIRARANFATGTQTDFAAAILHRGFNFAMGYSYFVEDSSRFTITYREPNAPALLTAQVGGIINPAPERTFPDWGERPAPYRLQFYADSLAYLKIGSFAGDPSGNLAGKDILRFYRKSFAELKHKQVGHLIVDLRDNAGGNPRMASELLRYFVQTPFSPIAYSQLKTQKVTTINKVRNPKAYRICKSALKCEQGRLVVRRMGLYHQHTPQKNRFQGKVYFLMNAKCASATSLFLAFAEKYQLGVFIGENPSGNYEYVCGHQLMQFTLPTAELTIQMPLQKSKLNTTHQGRKQGVRPHHHVPDSLQDLLTFQDTQLRFVLALIASSQQGSQEK